MMEANKTKRPVQTVAAMATSPSYTLIEEHKLGKRKPFIKTPLYCTRD